jgi:sucrose phosphorylase
MLALQGVPGIYLHSLFGSPNDHAGYAASGWKRDLNHERLDLPTLESSLAEPASRAARVFTRYAGLLAARRAEPAFHPNAPQQVLSPGPGVFALRRGPRDGRTVLALHNLSAEPRAIDPASLGGADAADATDLLSGRRLAAGAPLTLQPYEVAWLGRQVARSAGLGSPD